MRPHGSTTRYRYNRCHCPLCTEAVRAAQRSWREARHRRRFGIPVHACPSNGSGVTPCCTRRLAAFKTVYAITADPELVTCPGFVDPGAPHAFTAGEGHESCGICLAPFEDPRHDDFEPETEEAS